MKILQGTRSSWSERLSLTSIGIAALVLALGYGLNGRWIVAPVLVGFAVLWGGLQIQGRASASAIGLAMTLLVAAVGFWLGVGAGWLLVGAVAALSAWDLDQFEQHLRRAGQVRGRLEMERRHLLRLALVDAVGILLGIVALQVQVRISFLAALLLAGLLALGAGELIIYLRQGRKG
jgi:hypothetical protein